MTKKSKNSSNTGGVAILRPKTRDEFNKLHRALSDKRYIAIDALKPGSVHNIVLGDKDPTAKGAKDMSVNLAKGNWCNGPLRDISFSLDERTNTIENVTGPNGKPMGLGYVKWGPGDCIPSTIPVWAQALPYTAAPLRYLADLTAGLGPKLMYRFGEDDLVEFKFAGERLHQEVEKLETEEGVGDAVEQQILKEGVVAVGKEQQVKESPALKRARQALEEWEKTWYGEDVEEENEDGEMEVTHIPGAKEFLEENNLNLHLSQCEQDDVMLDIYFPTVGLQQGRKGLWGSPKIVQVSMISASTCRLEKQNEHGHINHCYRSESLRTKGAGTTQLATADKAISKFMMYPAAMPQHLLSDLRYIVKQNQKTSVKKRPTWIVCPTFYPSLNKPYYPQPSWWSVFTSKAFDFSSTVIFDKAKQRENKTSWGRILYISLDYLNQVFSDEGLTGNEDEQQKFIDNLESSMEEFLQHRDNHGKMMRQWMWLGPDGKEHENIKIVDIKDAVKDEASAGKDELELATSPIFLALGVDPRLVGVPLVNSSNGGTAVRELHLLKQQQLNVKQRLYLQFMNTVARFNMWDEHAEFHIAQQTLTTLDNSKTGTVETIAGLKA